MEEIRQMIKKMAILGISFLILSWVRGELCLAFTIEEMADLREMANQQFGMDLTRERVHYGPLLFMDKTRGWVETGPYPRAQTEDGGMTWKLSRREYLWQDEPWTWWGSHAPPPTKGAYSGAFFVNAKTGWWVSGQLYRTTDGGGTWDELKTPRYIDSRGFKGSRSIWFANEKEGWIYTNDGFVFRTKDGGDTWDQGTSFFGTQGGPFMSIRFLNTLTGYLVGDNTESIITRLPGGGSKEEVKWREGMIFYTHDGGNIWKRPETSFRVFPPNGIAINDVAIVSEKEAWVVGSLPKGRHAWKGSVWRTIDGNVHWELVVRDVPEYFNSVVVVEQEGGPAILILSQAGKVYRIKLKE